MFPIILIGLFVENALAKPYHMTCYYNWNQPPIEDVDPTLCSHIILIGQVRLDNLGHLQLPPTTVSEEFSKLKRRRSDIKLLVCLTGPNEAFSTLVSSADNIAKLADSSYNYLKQFSLDGMDIDWEFPSWSRNSQKTDRNRFPLLLKTLRDKFGSSFLLTVAVSGPPTISKVAYDTMAFNKYVDLVQVMNYDFHIFSYAHPIVGFNAPLRRITAELGVVGEMNSEASMSTWAKMGLWSNKTIFGIPTYGRGFRLVNWRISKPYSLAAGPVDDINNYPEICRLLDNKSVYTYVWNDKAASPYLHGTDKLWLSFEDVRSVKAKANYAKELNIAGVMVYHIGSDDVYGSCGNGSYPLLRAINREIQTVRTTA
uniref:GH18 domain-containing protein n=1 Tax=Haemonchus contortus TaxID=6289 RepID=A0A7I4Y8C2_HAECO